MEKHPPLLFVCLFSQLFLFMLTNSVFILSPLIHEDSGQVALFLLFSCPEGGTGKMKITYKQCRSPQFCELGESVFLCGQVSAVVSVGSEIFGFLVLSQAQLEIVC